MDEKSYFDMLLTSHLLSLLIVSVHKANVQIEWGHVTKAKMMDKKKMNDAVTAYNACAKDKKDIIGVREKVMQGHAEVGFCDDEITVFFDCIEIIKRLCRANVLLVDEGDDANVRKQGGGALTFSFIELNKQHAKTHTPLGSKKSSAADSDTDGSGGNSSCRRVMMVTLTSNQKRRSCLDRACWCIY